MIEKKREKKNVDLCLIDYRKPFGTVAQEVLWEKNMIDMGLPKYILLLIKNLSDQQKVIIKTSYSLNDFQIEQGVRRVYAVPHLFKYRHKIDRNILWIYSHCCDRLQNNNRFKVCWWCDSYKIDERAVRASKQSESYQQRIWTSSARKQYKSNEIIANKKNFDESSLDSN